MSQRSHPSDPKFQQLRFPGTYDCLCDQPDPLHIWGRGDQCGNCGGQIKPRFTVIEGGAE